MTQQLSLTAVDIAVSANAGDDVVLPFAAANIDTTSWTLACVLYKANSLKNGPDGGASVGSATIVNAPGVSSQITLTIGSTITGAYKNEPLFGQLKKTNSGSARTLANIVLSLE